jgi:hypothetical protein
MIVRQIETQGRIFYHGTGAASAKAIFSSGARGSWLETIGARTLGRAIRDAIFTVTRIPPDEAFRLHSCTERLGLECRSPWVSALLVSDGDCGSPAFCYDHFCVSLAQSIAYRYTLGNPYRSEFIHALADGLEVLEALGHSLPRTVESRFPRVHSALTKPSSPVVLEIGRVCKERLRTDEGRENIDIDLELYDLDGEDPTISMPGEFRVLDITADDIIAVHDLSDWPSEEDRNPPWRPEPSRVSASRRLTRDWIALHPRSSYPSFAN